MDDVSPADGMAPMGLGRIDTPGDRIARFYLHLGAHRTNQRVNGGTGHSVAASTRMAREDAAATRGRFRSLVIGRRRMP